MTDLDKLIAAAVAVAEAMPPEERAAMMEAQRQSWARGEASLAEPSASPPRVPVSSAHPGRVGVESGPGQPMDAREAVRQAMVAVESMGADLRLTDTVHFLQHAKIRLDQFIEGIQGDPLNMVISAAELNRLYALEREAAAEIRRLRAQCDAERDYKAGLARLKEIKAEGCRAGVEAAAKAARTAFMADERKAVSIDTIEAAIRALKWESKDD